MKTLDIDEVYAIYRHSRGYYGLVECTIFLNHEDAEKRAEELNKADQKLECKAVILADFIDNYAEYCKDAGYKMAMQHVSCDNEAKP